MATSTNQKPRPISAIDPELEQDALRKSQPDIRIRNDVQNRSGNTFAYVILALVLLFGGYMLYSYNSTGNPVDTITNKTDILPPASAPLPPATADTTPTLDAPAATGTTNQPTAPGTVQPGTPSTTTTAPATTTP